MNNSTITKIAVAYTELPYNPPTQIVRIAIEYKVTNVQPIKVFNNK